MGCVGPSGGYRFIEFGRLSNCQAYCNQISVPNGWPNNLLWALIQQESSCCKSSVGPLINSGRYRGQRALGIAQIVQGAHPGANVYDWRESLAYAERTIRGYYTSSKTCDRNTRSWAMAIAAWKTGPGCVLSSGGVPETYDSTVNEYTGDYVRKIFARAGLAIDAPFIRNFRRSAGRCFRVGPCPGREDGPEEGEPPDEGGEPPGEVIPLDPKIKRYLLLSVAGILIFLAFAKLR